MPSSRSGPSIFLRKSIHSASPNGGGSKIHVGPSRQQACKPAKQLASHLRLTTSLTYKVGTLRRDNWSGRDNSFDIFGMSWDVSGSGLGTFGDRFGKVLEKMSGGLRT